MRIGWLSTGRDEAATNLLRDVLTRAESDHVPLEIAVVFCDREPGEAAASDRFLQFARSAGLVVETVSSAQSWRRWQTQAADLPAAASRQAWREQFHDEVMWHLRPYQPDLLVLAGYMLIVSPPMCERYAMLNLHPALPGGPTGTWQEVIWELLRTRARETGAMMHLVTPELDRGPAISYVRFAITGPAWDGLWKEYLEQEERLGFAGLVHEAGESQPLFAEIRRRGEEREIPLIYQTLKQFVLGNLRVEGGRVVPSEAASQATANPTAATFASLPVDLTAYVEAELAAHAQASRSASGAR